MTRLQRFVVTPAGWSADGDIVIILLDYKFWTDNYQPLIRWCNLHDHVTRKGMTVIFRGDSTLTAFLLRWS